MWIMMLLSRMIGGIDVGKQVFITVEMLYVRPEELPRLGANRLVSWALRHSPILCLKAFGTIFCY